MSRHITTEADLERERIEQVFGLLGGELADEPWVVTHIHEYANHLQLDNDSRPVLDPDDFYEGVWRYWYEGAPEYADDLDTSTGTLRTAITWGGGYLPEPDQVVFDGDGEWKLVNAYMSSGEAECPARTWDLTNRVEDPLNRTRVVTFPEAACGIWADFIKGRLVCPLCEAEVGTEHGYIYIGEGYEAVYELVERPKWEVIVGNIGTVYRGEDEEVARKDFRGYVQDSKQNYGRAAGEPVTLMKDGEIEEEYEGQPETDGANERPEGSGG